MPVHGCPPAEASVLEVRDLQGRLLGQKTWPAGSRELAFEGLPSGMYVWALRTQKGHLMARGKITVVL